MPGREETAASPGDVDGPLTDIAVIAAQPQLRRSRWLQAVVCADPSKEFVVREITRARPQASGGDVLIRVVPARTRARTRRVEVWAVAQHAVVPVAAWENLPAGVASSVSSSYGNCARSITRGDETYASCA
jgi:hypothetical protein